MLQVQHKVDAMAGTTNTIRHAFDESDRTLWEMEDFANDERPVASCRPRRKFRCV